jgi:hypothetical protein
MKYYKFLLPAAVLLAIILLVFGRTFGNYFLEDDFGEVCYVSKIFEGNLGLLFSNFTGNYMQIPTMAVYRPWLLMSLVFDFMFWRTNAFGYYLTNIAFMFGAGLMLFVVLRTLTDRWGERESMLASLLAAALFVSNPLHSEAVSLVVGRVDIICAFFYLISFYSFIKRACDRKRPLGLIGSLFFWLAMITKEMAIGLPVLLFSLAFIFPERFPLASDPSRQPNRLIVAFKTSALLWINTVVYFVVRFFALGTLTGGYTGGVGAGQLTNILAKWKDMDTLARLFFPLNLNVFGASHHCHDLYSAFYFVLAAILLSKFIIFGVPGRWLLFMLAWIATTLLPIYSLWGIGYNLEGSRFVFFLTMPLCAIAPILLFAPPRANADRTLVPLFRQRILPLSALAIALFVGLNAVVAYRNNVPWLHAGKQTRACMREGQKLSASLPAGKKAVVLGIPKEEGGAHMILNGITFEMMMSPPFSRQPLADKLITFDPVVYGRSELINPERFRQVLKDPATTGCYLWNEKTMTFERIFHSTHDLSLPPPDLAIAFPKEKPVAMPFNLSGGDWNIQGDALSIKDAVKPFTLKLSGVRVDPLQYDFLELETIAPPSKSLSPIYAKALWSGSHTRDVWRDEEAPLTLSLSDQYLGDGKYSHDRSSGVHRLPLSSHWSWFTNGRIEDIQLTLPIDVGAVRGLKLVSAEQLVPKVAIADATASNTGTNFVADQVTIKVDASKIAQAAGIELSLSKPNYFFDNFSSTNVGEAILKRYVKKGSAGSFILSRPDLPPSGYCQIRAIGLDEAGRPVGEFSTATTLYMAKGAP